MIQLDKTILHNPDDALSREWLTTNGIGGYASSTIVGANTRRYHGLLVASFPPPLERQIVLSKVDEELVVERGYYPLCTNEYPNDVIHPDGLHYVHSFHLDCGIPTFEYRIANVRLTKQVWMEHGRDTVYVLYRLIESPCDVKLLLRPFCAFRGYHRDGCRHGQEEYVADQRGEGRIAIESAHAPYSLKVLVPGASFEPAQDWYYSFIYRADRERGFDCMEDLYTPGIFVTELSVGDSASLIASCERTDPDPDVEAALDRELSRRRAVARSERRSFRKNLLLAADQFVISEPDGRIGVSDHSSLITHHENLAGLPRLWSKSKSMSKSKSKSPSAILAGYHWFTDWGRDTMISLPGLLLSTGRFDEAHDILLRYIRCADGGMIPNRFTDQGAVEYNTADATLWYFHALYSYMRASGDDEIMAEVFPSLVDIMDWHFRGTRFGIHVDPKDGLLFAGREGSQVTWMDARVNGCPVTPRIGKPVEINALWFNALNLMASWAGYARSSGDFYMHAAERCRISFRRRFWNEDAGCLFDVVDGPAGDDPSIRPNQILAVSLPYSPLDSRQRKSVVDIAERELLTPYGLRTLSPGDPSYVGEYHGGPAERDRVYHQGTVWPWLLGPYADAHYRVYRDRNYIARLLRPFRKHLLEAGVGAVSEIFDGDAPHKPAGCISQAWSTAEILRIYTTLPDLA